MEYIKGFKWNEKQAQALAEVSARPDVRHIGLYGGSRSGKTLWACSIIKIRALKAPGSNHLIGRLSFNHAKRSLVLKTWPEMDKMVGPSIVPHYHSMDGYFEYPNGSRVWVGGYDSSERVDKILGNEYSTIFNNEASQLLFGTIETLRGRLAETVNQVDGTPLRQLEINDLNPTHNRHWSYREFIEGINPESKQPVNSKKYYTLQLNPIDNQDNLSPEYLDSLRSFSPLKRKRFFDGNYQADNENAVWERSWIDDNRVTHHPPLRRIVTAADPSGGGNDDTGIITAGVALHDDGLDHYYILSDATCGGSAPKRFEAIVNEHDSLHADIVVGESNFGGDIIEKSTRDTAELMYHRKVRGHKEIAYKPVVASKGKVLRAEPVSNLYYQGRVHHVGVFPELEDEMCQFTTDWNRSKFGSPNRVDADVFAVTELMVDEPIVSDYRPEVEFVGM